MENPSNLPIGDLFSTPKQKQRYYELFHTRKVIPSKYLDWNYFSECQMPLITDLENLGLKTLLNIKVIGLRKLLKHSIPIWSTELEKRELCLRSEERLWRLMNLEWLTS